MLYWSCIVGLQIRLISLEIGFFDFYIIPLAKKLKDCGVFGVSSDEVRAMILDGRLLM